MFKVKYLANLYEKFLETNKNETEFIQTVLIFLQCLDGVYEYFPGLETSGVLERLLEPERIIIFRVPWVDDLGRIRVNRGYRIQYSSVLGPYKGGIRFAPALSLSVLKALAFEQTLKNAITGFRLGGAKGGSDFSPSGKTDGEVMRFCQSFISELYRHIGAGVDIPAGDFGVGPREINYLYGYYKKLTNTFDGSFTGRALCCGGSPLRPEATGYGLCYFAQSMLKHYDAGDFVGKNIIISGSGQVGANAAVKAAELGGRIIAMSDISGVIYNPEGLDVERVHAIKAANGTLALYGADNSAACFYDNPARLWEIPCDIAFPCATQNEITLHDARALADGGVGMVCEGANMPVLPDALQYFLRNNILFGPGKAANAGGVAVSGMEMAQASLGYPWPAEEVDGKLKTVMSDIFMETVNTAARFNTNNLVIGANIAAFSRIYKAMLAQGII